MGGAARLAAMMSANMQVYHPALHFQQAPKIHVFLLILHRQALSKFMYAGQSRRLILRLHDVCSSTSAGRVPFMKGGRLGACVTAHRPLTSI